MIRLIVTAAIAFWAIQANADEPSIPHTIKSFAKAKKLAEKKFRDHRIDFYCGCPYDEYHHVNPAPCGLVHRENPDRASRIEWEHIVPAHAFGKRT